MKRLLLLATVAVPVVLAAQPVIDQVDAPQEGDVFPYIAAGYVPITESGTDVVWDLSNMGGGAATNLPCEAAAATAYGNQYPTATLALDGGNVISYLRADASGLYVVGVYKQVGGQALQIHMTDEQLMLPYPCTYGTEFSNPYTYSYTYTGGTVNGGGHGTYVADGFGTLILPYDTIHNVLKLSGTDTISESIPGTSYVTAVNQVYFYKPGIHYYVLAATHLSQSVNGGTPQEGGGISYLAQSMFAGIQQDQRQAIGLEAWPNPARDFVNVMYGIGGGHKVQLELLDELGRSVRSEPQATSLPGIQQVRLDVQDLPAGVYLLRLTDDHGQQGSCRVVVQ